MEKQALPQRQVHLDFHTSERMVGVGSAFDKAQFQRCLKKGHVNSITVFAKCHHGWAYFPSETNDIHPGLGGFDLLSAMLEAAGEIGVAAPIYLSAGLDEKYFCRHPEHGRVPSRGYRQPVIHSDGEFLYAKEEKARYHDLCMNTPYLDVLARQVEEVVRRYMPVGIFLDIVSERVCFCDACRRSVLALGLDESDDQSYVELGKRTYKNYFETINRVARSIKPDIRIFHNGGHILAGRRDLADADTHLELESLPTGFWGYDHFPKSATYTRLLGKEYLGMTGKFHLSWGEFGGFKHPNALRYEVALSLALGAKCSIGDQMHPSGFLDEATYELIGIAYKEAEAIEEYCYDVESVADIGVLMVESIGGAAMKNHPADVGATRILLESNYLFDMLDAECDFSKYKLLILPDEIRLTDALCTRLNEFVKGGGKLLCSGASGTNEREELAFDLGAVMLGESGYAPSYFRPTYPALGLTPSSYVLYSKLYDVKASDTAEQILGYSRIPPFNRAPEHFCSHQHTPYLLSDHAPGVTVGRDGGYIAWEIFREYAEVGAYVAKEIVCRTIDAILSDIKTLTTNLPSAGIVALNRSSAKGRHVLHLLYAIPQKRGSGVSVIEDLPTVENTELALRVGEVREVRLVPQNVSIPFTLTDGVCRFRIDAFSCSPVVVIEE